ncbi:anthranilate phosphoribosyltransferase [Amycolatopsis lexingtonensis]|uniref:Anthranilate phosphoribosyltransferase n=1 Tax=Amycolatopsis lexingtonensis TaxID=218822 RepID=A0ABR9I2I5_9PSEU|nr:anthranilate phosphoribosyltransferase [Amycolatopsis lexingtonensis]MBE1497406.1 anthranilate phosphoribosyltransferase [Amycolatopsis lexingtonensis]
MTTPVPRTWPPLLKQLIAGVDLSADDTAWAMDQIMSGAASPARIAGFAVALRAKGETPEEIAGMAATMLAHARRVELDGPAVDIVGTGGDGSNSVNISTMATIVTAAAGAPVAKHGNRSASSKSGAADVLEALGVRISLPPEDVRRSLEEVGIGFFLASAFHPALRHAGPVRSELGIPTTFNLLGPLTNPAQPGAAVIGCAYEDKTRVLAETFARRGTTALVVRGDDGLDEITTTTTSTVWVVSGGTVTERSLDPADLGIPRATAEDLRGGDAAANAEVVRELVAGKAGPVRDAVLINAAAALAAFTGFSGSLEDDLRAGLARAAEAIDSGAAATLLDRWIAFS